MDEIVWQTQRYYGNDLSGLYRISSNTSLTALYVNDRGQDEGTIKGHFLSLIGERSEINIGKRIFLDANFQLFYINYDGNNDGLFISPKISTYVKDVPFIIFFQATQPLDSNISPSPGFKWNLGLAYTLGS